MKTTVLTVGIVIALLGLLGAFRPKALKRIVGAFRAGPMLYPAAAVRVALGIVLLLAAPGCRYTIVVYALGVVALFSGVLLPVLGRVRFAALIGWWTGLSDGAVRVWTVLAILYGSFLAVAAF